MPPHAAPVPATALVVVAAGAGTRMRTDTRKPYLSLAGVPVLFQTLRRFRDLPFVRERFVVVAPQDVREVPSRWPELMRDYRVDAVVAGGAERVHSVAAGLAAVGSVVPDVELVAVHDGVRPLVSVARIQAVCRAAAEVGAAILACPVSDTLKREVATPEQQPRATPRIEATVPRERLWAAQTPQVFHVGRLRKAFAAWKQAGQPPVTDDASLLERLGHDVALVESPRTNIKLTTPEDMPLAEALLPHVIAADRGENE